MGLTLTIAQWKQERMPQRSIRGKRKTFEKRPPHKNEHLFPPGYATLRIPFSLRSSRKSPKAFSVQKKKKKKKKEGIFGGGWSIHVNNVGISSRELVPICVLANGRFPFSTEKGVRKAKEEKEIRLIYLSPGRARDYFLLAVLGREPSHLLRDVKYFFPQKEMSSIFFPSERMQICALKMNLTTCIVGGVSPSLLRPH